MRGSGVVGILAVAAAVLALVCAAFVLLARIFTGDYGSFEPVAVTAQWIFAVALITCTAALLPRR